MVKVSLYLVSSASAAVPQNVESSSASARISATVFFIDSYPFFRHILVSRPVCLAPAHQGACSGHRRGPWKLRSVIAPVIIVCDYVCIICLYFFLFFDFQSDDYPIPTRPGCPGTAAPQGFLLVRSPCRRSKHTKTAPHVRAHTVPCCI